MTIVGLSFLVGILIKQFLLRILLTIPPLPNCFSVLVNQPFLGRLLLLSTHVETKQLQFELGKNPPHLSAKLIQTTPVPLIKEWVKLIEMVDRLLFFLFVIISVFLHL